MYAIFFFLIPSRYHGSYFPELDKSARRRIYQAYHSVSGSGDKEKDSERDKDKDN
jgi:hypothetical protein